MSIRAMTWVWDQRLPTTAKFVLLALADHCDDNGICWPGIDGLAEKCGASNSTIRRALKYSEAAGLLERQRRHDTHGRETTSVYRLVMGVSHCTPGVSEGKGEGVTGDPLGGVKLTPESSEESSTESSSTRETTGKHGETDQQLVSRVAKAYTNGQVNNLAGYLSAALRKAGLPADDATIARYSAAVRGQPANVQAPGQRSKKYPRELLDAAQAVGVDPANRNPAAVWADVKSMREAEIRARDAISPPYPVHGQSLHAPPSQLHANPTSSSAQTNTSQETK